MFTTRWSLVRAAGGDGESGRRALDDLCSQYRPAVVAWFRGSGCADDEAEDLAQGLFLDLIERRAFADLQVERGRFRSWLRACAGHFAANHRRAMRALCRGGGAGTTSIQALGGDEHDGEVVVCVDTRTPDRAFDRAFAVAVLESALQRVADEWAGRGKAEVFARLRPYLEVGGGPGFAESADELGMRVGAVKVAVHRIRTRFREALTNEIRQTLLDPSDDPVDDELAALLDALAPDDAR